MNGFRADRLMRDDGPDGVMPWRCEDLRQTAGPVRCKMPRLRWREGKCRLEDKTRETEIYLGYRDRARVYTRARNPRGILHGDTGSLCRAYARYPL